MDNKDAAKVHRTASIRVAAHELVRTLLDGTKMSDRELWDTVVQHMNVVYESGRESVTVYDFKRKMP